MGRPSNSSEPVYLRRKESAVSGTGVGAPKFRNHVARRSIQETKGVAQFARYRNIARRMEWCGHRLIDAVRARGGARYIKADSSPLLTGLCRYARLE